MPREPVTVVIPVGPEPSHREWLSEAKQSVHDQRTIPGPPHDRVLMVADGIPKAVLAEYGNRIVTLPWRTGVAGAFNAGIGSALTELVIMLGSDDLLLPGAIDACVATWEEAGRVDAYYWMSIEYSDDREDKIQALPCNAAMVTRSFWKWCGGFPPETASGAPDAALISMLMVHAPEKIIAVQQGTPLTWVRVHDGQDTAGRGPWQGVIHATRGILTERGFQHG